MLSTYLSSVWSRKRRLLSTSVAVVLGVAFLAATMILGDTTKAGFSDTFAAANDGIDVVVRSDTRFGADDARTEGLIPESMVDHVAAVDGVAGAVPQVSGIGQLVDRDGQPLGGDGPPTIAANWADDPELNQLTLVEGRAPASEGDVVIDAYSARRAGLAVGDNTAVLVPDRVPVTIVGIATYGGIESVGGSTYVAFDLPTAQRLLGAEGRISSVLVAAEPGLPDAQLKARVAATLPDGVEALTGTELTAEQNDDIERDFLGFFRIILVTFAGIAVIVAAFSIHNTFSIIVAQRTRESALMRAIGASRRQVIAGVAVEALAVGIVATAAGFAAGVGIAAGLNALMESSLDMPPSDLVIGTGAIITAAVVGVGTTLLASIVPAIKASRVAPLAALRDVAADRTGRSTVRAALGAAATAAGAAWLLTATTAEDSALSRAGLGAVVVLAGLVILGPIVARPAAAIIGTGPRLLRGLAGGLARRNAMRNPRRTAASASALMVGTAVVALFTTFGSSIKATIEGTVDHDFTGDFVILPDGWSGAALSPDLAPAIEKLDGVESAVASYFGVAQRDGSTVDVSATEVDRLEAVFDPGVSSGSFAGFSTGNLAVSGAYADEHGRVLGSPIELTWVDGETTTFRVAAVYENRMTFGDLLISTGDLTQHVAQPRVEVILVGVADGVDVAAAHGAVAAVTAGFNAPDPMDRDEYLDAVAGEVDSMLFFIYGLLGVAVLIALIGIGNTLSLSIHERTRELGVLRAVGQDRSQVRSTTRWESVIIAVFGTVGGIGLGSFMGWALMRALHAQEGFGVFALPVVPLAVIVALAAAAGVIAAVRPARRAARTDILAAIASE